MLAIAWTTIVEAGFIRGTATIRDQNNGIVGFGKVSTLNKGAVKGAAVELHPHKLVTCKFYYEHCNFSLL